MRTHRSLVAVPTVVISIGALMAMVRGAGPAAETPRRGGGLLAAIAANAPSLDPHQEETFATIELVAPCYSTLLQIDPCHYSEPGFTALGRLDVALQPAARAPGPVWSGRNVLAYPPVRMPILCVLTS
jgi:hypothetical protein